MAGAALSTGGGVLAATRWAVGADISTQSVRVMLVGVIHSGAEPAELVVSSAWVASRPCAGASERGDPQVWLRLVIECIGDLKLSAPETALAEGIGISTTFPGIFAAARDGRIDPKHASLYDNTDDAGLGATDFEPLLAAAEQETFNRMWPGNMAFGLARLVRHSGLDLESTAALLPPNSAFACALLWAAGCNVDPGSVPSDLTETSIGGLYHSTTGAAVPVAVEQTLRSALPEVDPDAVRRLLPPARPSWTNAVPDEALAAVRSLLGLPKLRAVSIGAGDSPLGALALFKDRDTVINVRGSSDSPMIIIDRPRPRRTSRETVLHYPMPTAASFAESPWCAVAPMLRSGRVWDWVRGLHFGGEHADADAQLERLARDALLRRLRAPEGSPDAAPLVFYPALGGERAPEWDSTAAGKLSGLLETHDVGDIALAALEGMSAQLERCVELMESRYEVSAPRMLLAGGPTRNRLWNWVTQVVTGRQTLATTFSDASLLGAALLGHAACYARVDANPGCWLGKLSRLTSSHPLIDPSPVDPSDPELAELEPKYRDVAGEIRRRVRELAG